MKCINSQFNAPCEIGVQKKLALKDMNYIQSKSPWVNPPKALRIKTTRTLKPKNIIRIKLEGNSKDIIIKFPDKETLIKSLRELLDVQTAQP